MVMGLKRLLGRSNLGRPASGELSAPAPSGSLLSSNTAVVSPGVKPTRGDGFTAEVIIIANDVMRSRTWDSFDGVWFL